MFGALRLCINFANERLQKLFNDFVFLQEMKLYEAEGVACDRADFPDNSDIIALVQAGRKVGTENVFQPAKNMHPKTFQEFSEQIGPSTP